MREFRIASDKISSRSRDRSIRLILWGIVLVLSGITLFAVYGARSASRQVNTVLLLVCVLIVVVAFLGIRFFAVRLGVEKMERDLVFVLTDKALVRRRNGWPDIRIELSEINALYERRGRLVVESVEPRRKIVVPEGVDGFAFLRSELTKHSPLTIPRQR